MKKLPLSPGDHACTWEVGGQQVPGTVRLQSGQRPRALARGLPELWHAMLPRDDPADLPAYPYLEREPELRGRLLSDHEVVLMDVEVRHQFPGVASATAYAALVGRQLPHGADLNTATAEFQVGGLTELAGVFPLNGIEIVVPEQGTASDYRITWNADSRQCWMHDGDEVSVEFAPHTIDAVPYAFSITPYPVVRVRGARSRSAAEWLNSYAQPLMHLTTLATSRPQQIQWLELGDRHSPWTAQVFAENVVQDPYVAEPPRRPTPVVLRLGRGGAALPDLLRRWTQLEQHCGTLFEYLTSGMQAVMSTRTRYVSLLPTLEAFHSAEHGDLTAADNPSPEREELLQRITTADGVTVEDAEKLRAMLTPKPMRRYRLNERLRELAKDLPPVLAQQIYPRVDPIPQPLRSIVDGARDVWDVLGAIRNRLAHGRADLPSAEQLETLARLAHTLVLAHTVQQLGQPELLANAIAQDTWYVV